MATRAIAMSFLCKRNKRNQGEKGGTFDAAQLLTFPEWWSRSFSLPFCHLERFGDFEVGEALYWPIMMCWCVLAPMHYYESVWNKLLTKHLHSKRLQSKQLPCLHGLSFHLPLLVLFSLYWTLDSKLLRARYSLVVRKVSCTLLGSYNNTL